MKRGINSWAILGTAAVLGIIGGLLLDAHHDSEEMKVIAHARQVASNDLGPMVVPSGDMLDITEPDPESLKGLPAYPGSDPRKMIGTKGGILFASWFYTDDSVSKVVSFYEEDFVQRKRLFFVRYYSNNTASVSWMDREPWKTSEDVRLPDGILHMVSVLKQGARTLVLLSASDPMKLIEGSQNLPAWFVEVPNATTPHVIDVSIENLVRQSVTFDVRENEATTRAALLAAYKEKGWVIAETQVGEPSANRMELKKQSSLLTVALSPKSETLVGVVVSIETGGGAQ